jgi:hypothetical protein
MSLSTVAYLAGMLAMFVAERLLDGHEGLQWIVRVAALVGIGFAVGARLRPRPGAKGEGEALGRRMALIALLVGASSLLVYLGTTDTVVKGMKLGEEAEARWLGVFSVAWPIVLLLGTVPLLVLDHALQSSPVMIPVGRIRAAMTHGLVAAMGLCLVFPLNYVASKKNERWDLAYFKTPTPGTATRAIVDSLPKPVEVRIFMPPSSEVAQELRSYFAGIEGPNLSVEILDQAAQPRLAQALGVRDNGTVTLTQGDIAVLLDNPPGEPDEAKADPAAEAAEPKDDRPAPVTQRVTINADFEKAKRTLKKIDREVQKALIQLSQGERIAYFTTGHGELEWTGGELSPVRSIKAFRQRLRDLGFKIKTLGLREGLGEKVPDDAGVVIVAGPRRPFIPAEITALSAYIQGGGSVLLALGPKVKLPNQPPMSDPMDGLLEEIGVRRGEGVLAAEGNIVVINHNKEDRFNVFSNSFTSHGSTRNLAAMDKRDFLFVPASGFLEEVEDADASVTFTVRSLSTSWNDVNMNAELDAADGEKKDVRNIVAAITGGGEGGGFRVIVTPAATSLVDLAQSFAGNAQFVDDSMNWLMGTEELSGTTESEEDVKIEHTKDGQATWFYLTVLGVPLGVLVLGALRLRWRRRSAKGAIR